MQQKLEEKDENTVEIKETFSSLQQEVDSKTKKLKKVIKHSRTSLWASVSGSASASEVTTVFWYFAILIS